MHCPFHASLLIPKSCSRRHIPLDRDKSVWRSPTERLNCMNTSIGNECHSNDVSCVHITDTDSLDSNIRYDNLRNKLMNQS